MRLYWIGLYLEGMHCCFYPRGYVLQDLTLHNLNTIGHHVTTLPAGRGYAAKMPQRGFCMSTCVGNPPPPPPPSTVEQFWCTNIY